MERNKFQIPVEIPHSSAKTGYNMGNMLIGSCFTENMGRIMTDLKFCVDINPFGILYNPASIAAGLRDLLHNRMFTPDDLVEHNGLWHSFAHHGHFSATTAGETLKRINERMAHSSAFLKKAGFLFITFGTAWIYRYKKTGKVVANCHKIPETQFDRCRLTVDDIATEYNSLLKAIRQENPACRVIFTVSPIRHIKDGAIENQRSKSVLLLAIDRILAEAENNNCSYFPAYEIVMDELRDYRFYADDMIHISDTAINHIWDRFKETYIDTESMKIIPRVQKINRAVQHRPFNKNSPEYLSFVKSSLQQIEALETQFPSLDFEQEKRYFNCELYGNMKNSL